MNTQIYHRTGLCLLACLFLTLAACQKFSGTYAPVKGPAILTVNFKSSSKVEVITFMEGTFETTYDVDGNNIKIHAPKEKKGNDIILVLQPDGSLLYNEAAIKLVKK